MEIQIICPVYFLGFFVLIQTWKIGTLVTCRCTLLVSWLKEGYLISLAYNKDKFACLKVFSIMV